MSAKEGRAASAAAQLVAAIAYVELPLNEWPDLLRILNFNVVGAGTDLATQGLRRSSLEALGFICEEGVPAVLEASSAVILGAVVHGLGAREPSAAVRQAAATALLNSLDFLKQRLETAEEERNAVLRAVFEAIAAYRGEGSTSADETLLVAVGALECLVRIGQLLYAHMRPYMHQGLGELTVNAMSSGEAAIALQGIEFWSTICEVETDLASEQDTSGAPSDTPLHHFARDSAGTVVPILLTRMAAQTHDDEDEDAGDEWTPAMAAATCLSLYALAVRDDLLALLPLRRFIEENLGSTDWHFREAAVLAFGSLLEGPTRDLLQPLALATFPSLFRLFSDPSVSVRDTNMWAVGRVCELHPLFIPLEHTEQLAGELVQGLRQPWRVAISSCWALMHLVRRIACHCANPQEEAAAASLLARILPRLTSLLLEAAQRADQDDPALRSAAFEALGAILSDVPAPDPPLLVQLVEYVLGVLEQSVRLAVEALSVDDQVRASDTQSSCAGLLSTAIRRLPSAHLSPAHLQRLGSAYLAVAQAGAAGKTAITSLEELFLSLGAILTELPPDTASVLAAPFLPYVLGALARPDEAQLCRVVIGFVSDLARACRGSPPVVANLDPLAGALQRILQLPAITRALKPLAITALGDLAAAVGGPVWTASAHCASSMHIFAAAAKISIVDDDDLDEVDFVCELRLALVEAITWIVQGAKDEHNRPLADPAAVLLPPVRSIVVPLLRDSFAPWCLGELGDGSSIDPILLDDIIRAVSGLIGDLADIYPGASEIRQLLRPLAGDFLRIVSDKISENTVATQRWARSML